ncbi:uncharacterized protein EI90DRAFT_3019971 [Cantharellus anzutake]|uniref:uncharacterized protein n=1 Tax=Cantharellus anzutake TaxID=1750568 RepID=UPI0019053CB6|nr:uncharacterized protein EI90DRAFT_3019971 [Cantharellus anzutake]KAF8322911.1 hypothetical protein EI90DRAFT_3019971 [Cantharellus anzutake]
MPGVSGKSSFFFIHLLMFFSFKLYAQLITIHLSQLTALVHPHPITSVTTERLALSRVIKYDCTPRWTSLAKESNAVYSEEAICREAQIPEEFGSPFQCSASDTRQFLPTSVFSRFLRVQYLQANKSKVNLEMSKIQRSFALVNLSTISWPSLLTASRMSFFIRFLVQNPSISEAALNDKLTAEDHRLGTSTEASIFR